MFVINATEPIALITNTISSYNTAIGINALKLTTGPNNTAVGGSAMFSNAGGSENSAFGLFALQANVSGTTNTAIGQASLFASQGTSNSAVGALCLRDVTSGSTNSGLGYNVGLSFPTSGSSNTMLGANSSMTANFSNSACLGAGCSITASNQIVLGTSAENITIAGNVIIGTVDLFRKHSIAGAFLWDSSNKAYPIYSTISDYNTYNMNDIDNFYTVCVGYKLVVYQASAFGLLSATMDNTSGTAVIRYPLTSGDQGSSCKLFYKSVEITEIAVATSVAYV